MATPIEWLNESQINTGTADVSGISDPQIIGLSNGNYLVAWVEVGTTGVGTTPGNDIIGKIFDAEGGLVRDSFRINTFGNTDDEEDFDIAPTNDGGFSMVYLKDGPGADQEFIIYQRLDDNGDPVAGASKTILTNTVAGEVYSNPKIVVNNDDNSAYITYTDVNAGETEVHGVRVDAAGNILTAEFDAAQNSTGNFSRNAEAAINTNGELVTAYEEDDGGTVSIELFIANTAGAQQHNVTVSSGTGADAQVATLTNGNIVVTWSEDSTVYYRVFNSNASTILGETQVYSTANILNESSVKGLPDGGFVIVWDNDSLNTLEGRRYNADGSNDTTDTVFQIEPTDGAEVNPNVGVTGDGRILISYEENDNVFASIWDTRGGTVNADDYDGVPLNFVENNVTTTNVIDTTLTGDASDDTLLGQGGNDLITGGSGVDSIEGGDGNDTIDGGLFNDTVNAGAGDDSIVISSGNDSDIVNGGSGTDTLDFSASSLGGDIIFTGGTSGTYTNGHTFSGIEVIKGGTASSTYNLFFGTQNVDGGAGNDLFVHGNGEFIDTLHGGAGDDTLDLSAAMSAGEAVNIDQGAGTWTGFGGTRDISGFESIIGTQGNDTILGGNIADTIDGQGGDDFLDVGGGSNPANVMGGDGNDTIVANNGNAPNETLDGGAGTDLLDTTKFTGTYDINLATGTNSFGETFINFENVVTGNGDNDVTGTFDVNVITTGSGDDTILGGGGADTINSGAGNDFVNAQSGGNVDVDAGAGNDTVVANNGLPETLDGGADTDLLDTTAFNSAYSINLDTGATNFGGESFINFENVVTGNGDTTVTGTAGDNVITTGTGADSVDAGFGADTIDTGTGQDTVNGGGGNDVINLDGGADIANGQGGNDLINGGLASDTVQGGSGSDTINGDEGGDSLLGGTAGDVISGGAGNDTIRGQQAADVINGEAGNDSLFGDGFNDTLNGGDNNDSLFGGGNGDVLNGDNGADQLFGQNGADTLDGGSGADFLNGGALNDELRGGSEADTLLGSTGDDRLYGDGGADIFQFNANHGNFDRIFDFEGGTDVIQFSIAAITDISDLTLSNFFNGVDIDYGTGSIRVFGISDTDLSNADFLF